MSTRFSQQLINFARSIDIVNVNTAEYVRELIQGYFAKIGVDFYVALLDGLTIDDGPGLGTFQSGNQYWATGVGHNLVIPVRREDGRHHSLTSCAYDMNKPLWVVESTGGPLTAGEGGQQTLEDRWSQVGKLPPFSGLGGVAGVRTLIAVPLSHAYRVLGVLSIQFKAHVLPSEAAKQDFKNLADAIAVVISLYQVRQAQIADTAMAGNPLRALLQDGADSPFVKPRLFLAYSERADPKVIQAIRGELDAYKDGIDIEDWRRNGAPGEIKARLSEAVTSCRYAICYLSEPDEVDGTTYRDNPNVLFEAGMFNSLSLCATASCQGWIPLREAASPDAPFDLASVNMIRVQRGVAIGGAEPDLDTLREDLRNHLKGLLQQ